MFSLTVIYSWEICNTLYYFLNLRKVMSSDGLYGLEILLKLTPLAECFYTPIVWQSLKGKGSIYSEKSQIQDSYHWYIVIKIPFRETEKVWFFFSIGTENIWANVSLFEVLPEIVSFLIFLILNVTKILIWKSHYDDTWIQMTYK